MRLSIPLAALTLLFAGPALAQQATDDWDRVVHPESSSIMASVDFGNSLSIAVRCQDGGLDAVLGGLPPVTSGDTRQILLKFGDDAEAYPTSWNVGVNPAIAVSERPAGFARELRQGGRLEVTAPGAGEGGRNLRYVLDLPSAHAVLDQTLTTCGKPLEDPRDAELAALGESGLPGGLGWARPPRADYPTRRVYERGFAVITCLSQADGGLRACEIETEQPRDGGFGQAALDATRRARLENTAQPGQPITTQMIAYRTNFRMESPTEAHQRLTTPTRLAPRRD